MSREAFAPGGKRNYFDSDAAASWLWFLAATDITDVPTAAVYFCSSSGCMIGCGHEIMLVKSSPPPVGHTHSSFSVGDVAWRWGDSRGRDRRKYE